MITSPVGLSRPTNASVITGKSFLVLSLLIFTKENEMNKKIFASSSNTLTPATAVNQAGGRAFSLSDEAALAQLTVTGCLNNTYYSDAESQLKEVTTLAEKCSDEFLARCAVYAHQHGKMKDMPAVLLGVLVGRRNHELVSKIFDKVVTNQKMLRNFVQVVRSGTLGFKSLGSNTRNLIRVWLANKTSDELFRGSVGQSPSLGDVVKLTHPKPESKNKEAFYGWLIGRKYNKGNLPAQVKLFEKFKAGEADEVPNVDFRMLTALDLSEAQWKQIARRMPWNALRININTLLRHNVFSDAELTQYVANKLGDKEEVQRNNAFPYQLMTTYQNIDENVPMSIKLALQSATEFATQNIPQLEGETVVLVDTSSSMSSPVTGHRKGSTTKTTCVDVAALIAASILRKNPNAKVVSFNTTAFRKNLNPLDSIMTNAQKLSEHGGGTDCSCGLRYLNTNGYKADNVIMISDNESWVQQNRGYGSTPMNAEWVALRKRNPEAKLVCLDIQPSTTTQVMDAKSVMNCGGFNDGVFQVIADFFNGDNVNFVQTINSTEI